MRLRLRIRRFANDEQGSTMIEFAVVATMFFMLMLGIIEYGMIMLTKVAVESAVVESSRSASIGSIAAGCADRVCSIKKLVADKTMGLVSPQSVVVDSKVVSNAAQASPVVPDICLDNPSVPYPATCTVWQDNNPAAGYQPPTAITAMSIGQPGQLIEIRVTYLWRVLFPMFRSYFGTNGVLTISSSTVVKNEPFDP